MKRSRRWAGARLVVTVVVAIAAGPATAWYGPFVFVSPESAQPGTEVTARGYYFAKTDPVEARLDAVDGRVLARFTPASGSKGMEFQGPVPIPADVAAGVHTLVFTQHDASGRIVQMPPRALVTVTDPTGAAPVLGAPLATDTSSRPATLARADDDRLDPGSIALIAVGAAGVALFAGGIVALAASRPSRRRPTAVA